VFVFVWNEGIGQYGILHNEGTNDIYRSRSVVKVHPVTCYEYTEGIYSFSNLAARWGWLLNATLRPLYLRTIPDSHCIGGWMGPRAVLDDAKNLIPPAGVQIRTFQSIASRYTEYAVPAHHVVFVGF
jgi:hypothetical protein